MSRSKRQETDRSTSVHINNWREEVMLRRTLDDIQRVKSAISNEIWLEQRVFYKRFQDKITRSQLSYARATGDKSMERNLRERLLSSGFNSMYGMNEEDMKLLQKLLHQRHEFGDEEKTPRTMTRATEPMPQIEELPRKPVTRRPQTVGAVMNRRNSNASIASVVQSESSMDIINTYRIAVSESRGMTKRRSDRSQTALPRIQTEKTKESTAQRLNVIQDPDELHRNFLQRLNTRRLKTAKYDQRIKTFCNSVQDLKTSENLAGDHYAQSMDIAEKKSPRVPLEDEEASEDELQQYIGDLDLRISTMRRLKELANSDHIYTLRRPSIAS